MVPGTRYWSVTGVLLEFGVSVTGVLREFGDGGILNSKYNVNLRGKRTPLRGSILDLLEVANMRLARWS